MSDFHSRPKPQSRSNIPQHFEPTKSLTEGFQKPKGTAKDIYEFVHAYVCMDIILEKAIKENACYTYLTIQHLRTMKEALKKAVFNLLCTK